MKKLLSATAALLLTTGAASALGLDRSGQSIGVIFEDGRYAEFSLGYVMPTLEGKDEAAFGGQASGNVANNYIIPGIALKADINSQASFAFIYDQPYGANISYPTPGSVALGGTAAKLKSSAFTVLGRYKFNENFSVHGGLRSQTTEANITLGGPAYGPANGYNVDLASDTAYGYTVGAAYERPDIALRVALTYVSEIEHEFGTIENGNPSLPTEVTTPQALNLDFQTGVAADTLVFGSIRWAEYTSVIVAPFGLGSSLTDIDDGVSYNIGVGRRFSDTFSGQVSIGYEASGDELVSPLSPSNGNFSIGLGGQYTVDNMKISGGVRYITVGDAKPQTADTARAAFADNSAIAVGVKVGFTF